MSDTEHVLAGKLVADHSATPQLRENARSIRLDAVDRSDGH
jgi:hypothetical protein